MKKLPPIIQEMSLPKYVQLFTCCTMVHSILACLFALVCTVMAMPKHIYPLVAAHHPEDYQRIQNDSSSTTMWLYTPTSNNREHRIGTKRKREGTHNEMSDTPITVCSPNAALRECTEISISRILYTNLKQHHVAEDLTECFCVTEGYDVFESESSEHLFIDGTVIHEYGLHAVRKYTGNPLPYLDISFPDSSDDLEEEKLDESMDVVCWPNPLLGECKEAEISHAELNDLISEWNGDDFLLDSCTCASQGFSIAVTKKRGGAGTRKKTPSGERYAGVQTYAPTPRVTLCFFDGKTPEHGLWMTEGGREIEKGSFCKQVTIVRSQYSKPRDIKRFNDAGVSECKGGCAEFGYSVIVDTASKRVVSLRFGKAAKNVALQLIPFRYRKTSPGEWVYTYHSIDYDPRVTLCYFDGEEVKDSSRTTLWWNTNDGGAVRERELCKQVTMSRDLYVTTSIAPGRKERFNKYGIYECGDGGCAQMGYSVLRTSNEIYDLTVREDTRSASEAPPPTKKRRKKNMAWRTGKPFHFRLVHFVRGTDKQARERVDTYTLSTTREVG